MYGRNVAACGRHNNSSLDFAASQHFIASSVRFTIPPYMPPQTELCVAFTILDNKVALEPNKTFSIKVLPSPKVVLLRPISHVLIVDDDGNIELWSLLWGDI